ncbi:hypothetical protein CWATWH0003_5020 [Crocosphaera watsonii WH 0003]|uniref:Uncharacterized protein n=1 Tax=Crocosphaera watsonii WH 0003 TaxID=423471 RepID=G5JC59_CROWT|nr:hypothetical protein CWATWH0003_5020 [Crocosphaera watsonii WH 0003]
MGAKRGGWLGVPSITICEGSLIELLASAARINNPPREWAPIA